MTAYKTKTELLIAYANKLELDGMTSDAAKMVAQDNFSYSPHLYRGGYVVRQFGYSVERITNGYVTSQTCGNPELI